MMLGSTTTFGLDLGTTGVRAVEVSCRGNRPVVEKWAAADFPADVEDWQAADTQEIGAFIGDLLASRGIRGRWVAHSVCGQGVTPQYFNFPQLMPEDVADAVRIEVEAGLPFRVEDAMISYILFPEMRPETNTADRLDLTQGSDRPLAEPGPEQPQRDAPNVRTHGLAIAADGEFVESRLSAIRRAKLEPFCVEADATSCVNAYLATSQAGANGGSTAIINIGKSYSNVAVIDGERTLLIRDIPVAGAQMTRAVAEVLSVPQEEAEALKRQHWAEGPSGNGALGERLPDVLERGARDLADRLQDTIQYWVGERLVPGLRRVLLTGGGSQVHGLAEFMSEAFSVPVERWSPLMDTSPEQSGERAPWEYRLSVAFGLALRKFPKGKS